MSEINKKLISQILEAFGVAYNIEPEKIENLKVHKSKLYGMCDVFAFDFNGHHYYISNDYSLDDNPQYFKEILLDLNHLLKGNVIKNPNESSELKYSVSVNNNQYYLWRNSK